MDNAPVFVPESVGWRLAEFTGAGYDKGRGWLIQATWFAISNVVFRAWWFPARLRPVVLRLFGAQIGHRVLIRHGVRVLWPWKLTMGSDTWIGEDVWLLNLETITIGSNVCVSQGAFLCTGSHRTDSPSFEYDNGSITIGDQTWVAAQALILRNVNISPGSVIGARAIVTRDVRVRGIVTAGERW